MPTLLRALLSVALLFACALAAQQDEGDCRRGCRGKHRQVCGADGRTYQNACLARCQGVEIASRSPCKQVQGGFLDPHADASVISQQQMEQFKDEGFTLLGVANTATFDPSASRSQAASDISKSKSAAASASRPPREYLLAIRYDFSTGLVYGANVSLQAAMAMAAGTGAATLHSSESPAGLQGWQSDSYIPPGLNISDLGTLPSNDSAATNSTSPPSSASSSSSRRRKLRFIMGSDDRREITFTAQFPYSAIGHLTFSDSKGTGYQCSGSMISARSVLTAAHCVFDRDTNSWQRNFWFAANQYGGRNTPFGSSTGAYLTTFQGYTNPSSSNYWSYDIAVVQLSNTNYGKSTGWLGLEWVSTYSGPLTTAGYPGDKPSNTYWWTSCQVTQNQATDKGMIANTCDIYGGQSGSPMFVSKNGQFYARGVVSHGTSWSNGARMNYATAVTQSTFDAIVGWK